MMLAWVNASVAFFIYVIVLAPLVPRLVRRRRLLAAAGSAVGLLIATVAQIRAHSTVLHGWLLPLVLLLLGYWSSGLLFAGPMPRAERLLNELDRLLHVDEAAHATARPLAELLEAAYAGVYPLVPLGLVVHLLATPAPDPDRFWTVVLVTDFTCFAFLPWIQTRPPRAFRSADPWISHIRRLNLRLLGKTSIQVNTIPSGHAAEALAVVLLVAGAPWPVVGAVAIAGVLVTLGSVLGRYHYSADALSGWMVAVGVWLLV